MWFDIVILTIALVLRPLNRYPVQLTGQICLTPVARPAEVSRHKAALAQADCGECRVNSQLDRMPVFALMVDPVRSAAHEWPVRAETFGR